MAVKIIRPGHYPYVMQVADSTTRQALKTIADQIAGMESRLATLEANALKVGSPVNAQRQRIQNAADPQQPQDLVTLATLRRQIATAMERLRLEFDSNNDGIPDGGGDFLGGIGAGSDPPTVELNDALADAVVAYVDAHPAQFANHCIDEGGSWDFMDGLVAFLQGIDERVGFNGKRGDVNDPSTDAIAYYHGVLPPVAGSNNVYVVDVISKSCSPEAGPGWIDVTTPRAAGAWLATRP